MTAPMSAAPGFPNLTSANRGSLTAAGRVCFFLESWAVARLSLIFGTTPPDQWRPMLMALLLGIAGINTAQVQRLTG